MTDTNSATLLRRIETRAVMANGKVVTGHYSYPLGTSQETSRRIEAGLVRAFGRTGTKVVGIPITT